MPFRLQALSLSASNSDLSSCLWLFMAIRCFFMHRTVHVDHLLPCGGALLSCIDKKVTKEATRGGTEVDPFENPWFRSPSPRIKIVLPGAPPDKTSSQLCFLSSNIRPNSDLSSRSKAWQGPRLLLEEKLSSGARLMRCAVKCCVFIEIYGEFETFSTSSAPSGHLLLKEKALVRANLKQFDKSEFWFAFRVWEFY